MAGDILSFASEIGKTFTELQELIIKMKESGTSFTFDEVKSYTHLEITDINKIKEKLNVLSDKSKSESEGFKILIKNEKRFKVKKRRKSKIEEVKIEQVIQKDEFFKEETEKFKIRKLGKTLEFIEELKKEQAVNKEAGIQKEDIKKYRDNNFNELDILSNKYKNSVFNKKFTRKELREIIDKFEKKVSLQKEEINKLKKFRENYYYIKNEIITIKKLNLDLKNENINLIYKNESNVKQIEYLKNKNDYYENEIEYLSNYKNKVEDIIVKIKNEVIILNNLKKEMT